MPANTVRFKQVDVFTSVPFKGNPLAELQPGSHYTARQGTVLGRAGNVSVHYDDAAGKTWIGGPSVTIVNGTFRLP